MKTSRPGTAPRRLKSSVPSRVPVTLEKSTVAELPRSSIDHMNTGELVRVIQSARLPAACSELALGLLDIDELRQLACLARKCCQTETANS